MCQIRVKVPIKLPLAARPVQSQERYSQTCQPNELSDSFLLACEGTNLTLLQPGGDGIDAGGGG